MNRQRFQQGKCEHERKPERWAGWESHGPSYKSDPERRREGGRLVEASQTRSPQGAAVSWKSGGPASPGQGSCLSIPAGPATQFLARSSSRRHGLTHGPRCVSKESSRGLPQGATVWPILVAATVNSCGWGSIQWVHGKCLSFLPSSPHPAFFLTQGTVEIV